MDQNAITKPAKKITKKLLREKLKTKLMLEKRTVSWWMEELCNKTVPEVDEIIYFILNYQTDKVKPPDIGKYLGGLLRNNKKLVLTGADK